MKDSDVEINIDPTIISDLKHIQQRLLELTCNNEDMRREIIEESLLLCKNSNHFYDDSNIIEAIKDQCRGMRRRGDDKEAREKKEKELFAIVFKLGEIITGDDKRITDPLKHLSEESTLFYKKLIREKIEEKVIEIFYPGGIEDDAPQYAEMMIDQIQETSMIGDIETQFDNMDV